jgi:glyoxylase-like metal-dependent hydrolase (beta-lactamase superfamily II)
MEVIGELQYRGLVVGVFEENCWIVGSRQSGEAICIDPGDEPDKILALARDMGVRIKTIANSHGHADHILGVAGVQRATGARFVLHAADLELVRHGWQGMAARMGIDVSEPPPEPDGFVAHGENVEVAGVRLRVIGTPGHTPGSVSYYSEGLLFSGDTLFRDSIGRTDTPGGSFEEEMESIVRQLLALPDDTVVLPGHMEQTTIAHERAHNPYLEGWLSGAYAKPGS